MVIFTFPLEKARKNIESPFTFSVMGSKMSNSTPYFQKRSLKQVKLM